MRKKKEGRKERKGKNGRMLEKKIDEREEGEKGS